MKNKLILLMLFVLIFFISCENKNNNYVIKYNATEIKYSLPSTFYITTTSDTSRNYRNHDNSVFISVSLNTPNVLADETMPFSTFLHEMANKTSNPQYKDYLYIYNNLKKPTLLYNDFYSLGSEVKQIKKDNLLGETELSLSFDDNKYLYSPFILQSYFISGNGIVSVDIYLFSENILSKMTEYGTYNKKALLVNNNNVVNQIYNDYSKKLKNGPQELVDLFSLYNNVLNSLRIKN